MSDFIANATTTAEAAFDRVDHGDIESLGLNGFQAKWHERMRTEERCRERARLVTKRLANPNGTEQDKTLQSFQQAADALIATMPAEIRQSAVYWLIGSIASHETAERVKSLHLAKRRADEDMAKAKQKLDAMAREIASMVKSRHGVE